LARIHRGRRRRPRNTKHRLIRDYPIGRLVTKCSASPGPTRLAAKSRPLPRSGARRVHIVV
jgi:hypothetical protein